MGLSAWQSFFVISSRKYLSDLFVCRIRITHQHAASVPRCFFPFLPADAVDVALKVAGVQQGRQHILREGGHGTGIEARLLD